jgi:hypothetical protein
LFFVPDFARAEWPWALTPFNTRFLGAVYFSAFVAVAIMAYKGRWSPARPVLGSIFAFTVVVLGVTFLYLPLFDFQKWGTWLWMALYIILPLNAGIHLWLYRKQPPSEAIPVPPVWRTAVLGVAAVLGLYGLGLLVAPAAFSAFWPWPLDSFHGQLYSATFISGAVGLFTVARLASRTEFIAAGLTQALLGAFALIGLFVVDSVVHRVNASQPGTWLWIAIFAALLAFGTAMILAGFKARQGGNER